MIDFSFKINFFFLQKRTKELVSVCFDKRVLDFSEDIKSDSLFIKEKEVSVTQVFRGLIYNIISHVKFYRVEVITNIT